MNKHYQTYGNFNEHRLPLKSSTVSLCRQQFKYIVTYCRITDLTVVNVKFFVAASPEHVLKQAAMVYLLLSDKRAW